MHPHFRSGWFLAAFAAALLIPALGIVWLYTQTNSDYNPPANRKKPTPVDIRKPPKDSDKYPKPREGSDDAGLPFLRGRWHRSCSLGSYPGGRWSFRMLPG